MVRFAAMTYGKIVLIGIFALTGILLHNFHSPERYTHTDQADGIKRFDSLDGSVEVLVLKNLQAGWQDADQSN